MSIGLFFYYGQHKPGMLFPLFSIAYIIAPHSTFGQTMRKPFIKFICHSASYFTFLCKYHYKFCLLLFTSWLAGDAKRRTVNDGIR